MKMSSMSVATSTGTKLDLAMDGSKGELLEASGNLTLDAYAFTPTGRTLIISKSSGPYTVSATPINAIVLTGKTTVNGVRWLAAQDVLDRLEPERP